MNYFENLGKILAAEMCRNPASRQRLGNTADQSLIRHLAGPMARDAMPMPIRRAHDQEETSMPYGRNLAPRGGYGGRDQDPGPGNGFDQDPDDGGNGGQSFPFTSDDVITAVRQALEQLDDPDARHELLAGLQALVDEQGAPSAQGSGASAPPNGNGNGGGMDGRRRVARRVAADAAFDNSQAFAKRWPQAARVTVMGVR